MLVMEHTPDQEHGQRADAIWQEIATKMLKEQSLRVKRGGQEFDVNIQYQQGLV